PAARQDRIAAERVGRPCPRARAEWVKIGGGYFDAAPRWEVTKQFKDLAAVAALCGTMVVPGCASTGSLDDGQKLAVYRSAAGEPVSSFSYLGRINGWTPLDDRNIAVWTRPSEAFLLSFDGRCQDIDYTPMISLTSQANRVYAGF